MSRDKRLDAYLVSVRPANRAMQVFALLARSPHEARAIVAVRRPDCVVEMAGSLSRDTARPYGLAPGDLVSV